MENIDLSFNQLKTVEELDFARLPRLREINLKGNQLEMLSEMAFHNSTQLQILDLSHNKLDRIGERTLEGFTRVVSSISDVIFVLLIYHDFYEIFSKN